MMQVSVVIPTVRPAHLGDTIASICKQTWREWELIVVAQGNDSEMRAFIDRGHPDPRVRFLHLSKSGLSLARNAGIEAAAHPIILFTDDDCEAREDWVEVVAGCFADNPDVGLVSGAVLAPPLPRLRIANCPCVLPGEVTYYPSRDNHAHPPNWGWIGANFAVRRDVYARVGPFDTHLGPGARFPVADDVDFGMRLERADIAMLATPRSVIRHTWGTRYGLRSTLKTSASYARGNGALAGKLTLMGDPRGAEWLEITRRSLLTDTIGSFRLHRLPASLRRVRIFQQAYRECIREFCVDDTGLLRPRSA
jgi:glycosyltransferase involved in cell wall biosynthesis